MNSLNTMSDSEIEKLIVDAQRMLADRKEARKRDAIEKAREALAEADLTFADVAKEAVAKGVKRVQKAVVDSGRKFVHPETGQTWIAGRGRRPSWVAKLIERGEQDSGGDKARK